MLSSSDQNQAALQLQAIIETATDGIIAIDERGTIEMANPAACLLFGYQTHDLIGQNINMLMPEPFHSNHDAYLQNYMRTGQAKIIGIGREVQGRCKDGRIFPCRLSISEVKLPNRRLFTGIVHDLTEQRLAEENIRRMNAELEARVEQRTEELASAVDQLLAFNKQLEREIKERQAIEAALRKTEREIRKALEKEKDLSQLKSRFVSLASHEFRTPLSTIMSSAELIEAYTQAEQHEKRLRHTGRIRSAVSNLIGILNDFLSLSKLEEGRMQLQLSEFNFEEFCQSLVEELQGLLKAGQEIRISKSGKNSVSQVRLDKQMLRNILINLLSNAIKYSEQAPIDFTISINAGKLCIAITDYGVGIPKDEQQHIFTLFFRAHNVDNVPGTGLGLNIVRRYLDLMNGDISFESEEGKGTTFRVEIPLSVG